MLPAGGYIVYFNATAKLANFAEVGGGVGPASANVDGVFMIPEPNSLALLELALLIASRLRRQNSRAACEPLAVRPTSVTLRN